MAARLASGGDPSDAGTEILAGSLVRLPEPVVVLGDNWLEAEVTAIDRFGNVQLAAPGTALDGYPTKVVIGGLHAARGRTFGDARAGELVVYVDSAGRVAVAVNGGRAVVALGVTHGDVLRLEREN